MKPFNFLEALNIIFLMLKVRNNRHFTSEKLGLHLFSKKSVISVFDRERGNCDIIPK